MNKRIIAISGAQGTGKSALAYNICAMLKKKGHNIIVLDELARECPFPINKDADAKTQAWLICQQVAKELELMQRYEYVIVDRSVIDAHCYNEVVHRGEDSIADELLAYIREHIATYYRHTYIPDPNIFNYNFEDGVRDTDETFRQDVHDTIINVMASTGLTNYTVITSESEALVHILDNLEVK